MTKSPKGPNKLIVTESGEVTRELGLMHWDDDIRGLMRGLVEGVQELVNLCNRKDYEGREVTTNDVLHTLSDWIILDAEFNALPVNEQRRRLRNLQRNIERSRREYDELSDEEKKARSESIKELMRRVARKH